MQNFRFLGSLKGLEIRGKLSQPPLPWGVGTKQLGMGRLHFPPAHSEQVSNPFFSAKEDDSY